MQTKLTWTDGVGVLALGGRFDAHEAQQVRHEIEQVANQPDAQLLIDLADVNFIDSSGLATLVQGMKRCRTAGGDLRLCNLQQPVRIIFELTRLDKAFDIHADRATAIAAMLSRTDTD